MPTKKKILGEINKKILQEGEELPIVTLKDGESVQTGTVATMLHNIRRYNDGERGAIEQELEIALPTLIKIGLFELFPPQEWLSETNPGRNFLGLLALKYMLSRESKTVF